MLVGQNRMRELWVCIGFILSSFPSCVNWWEHASTEYRIPEKKQRNNINNHWQRGCRGHSEAHEQYKEVVGGDICTFNDHEKLISLQKKSFCRRRASSEWVSDLPGVILSASALSKRVWVWRAVGGACVRVCENGDLLLGIADRSSLKGIFGGGMCICCVFAFKSVWIEEGGGGRDVRIRKAASLSMLFEVRSERKTPTPFFKPNVRICSERGALSFKIKAI